MRNAVFILVLTLVSLNFVHAAPVEFGGSGMSQEECDALLLSQTLTSVMVSKGLKPGGGTPFANPRPAAPAPPSAPATPPRSAPSLPKAKDLSTGEWKIRIREQIAAQSKLVTKVVTPVTESVKTARIQAPMKRVTGFFNTMKQMFFEREELVEVMRKTVLSESSLLILGPGGTAKSDMADRLGENIVEGKTKKPSYFTLPLTQDTTASETQGGMIMEDALKGRTLRNWAEGVLGSKIVFLDEFFDGRLKFLRSFLKAFNERKYTQGRHVFQGLTKVFIAASNKYINQVYEMFGNNDPQALIDRFQFIYYAAGILQDTASILGLAQSSRPTLDKLEFEKDLEVLTAFAETIPMSSLEVLRAQHIFISVRRILEQEQVRSLEDFMKAQQRGERVQPPYRTTRVFSPRSLRKSFGLIRVQSLIRAGDGDASEVQVSPEDVDALLSAYLVMQGPTGERLTQAQDSSELDPYEQSQLETLKLEQDAIKDVLEILHNEENSMQGKVKDVLLALKDASSDKEIAKARRDLSALLDEIYTALAEIHQAEKIGAEQIAALYALHTLLHHPAVTGLLK